MTAKSHDERARELIKAVREAREELPLSDATLCRFVVDILLAAERGGRAGAFEEAARLCEEDAKPKREDEAYWALMNMADDLRKLVIAAREGGE